MEGCFVSWIEEVVKTPQNKTTKQTGQHDRESLVLRSHTHIFRKLNRVPTAGLRRYALSLVEERATTQAGNQTCVRSGFNLCAGR